MSANKVMLILVLLFFTGTITVASGIWAEPDQVQPTKPYKVTIVEDRTAVEPFFAGRSNHSCRIRLQGRHVLRRQRRRQTAYLSH